MRFDRIATGLCMLLAGPLILAGLLTSVWESGDSVSAALRAYLVDPARSEVSAVLLHFGYLLLLPTALGLAMVSHGAPRLRAAGLVAAVLGLSTLPGLLIIDFYDLALVAVLPLEQAARVEEQVGGYAGTLVIFLPTMFGIASSFVLLAAAAWRAGFAPWWSAVALGTGLLALTLIRSGGLPVVTVAAALLLVGLADLGRRMILSAYRRPEEAAQGESPTSPSPLRAARGRSSASRPHAARQHGPRG
jgi:hypothetical protein